MDDENDYLGMTLEAAVDYPELADIIAANPPPIEVTASRRKVASSWQVVDDGGNVLATYDSIEKATKAAGEKYHVMLQSNHTITDGAADPAVVEGMPPVTSPVGIRRQAEGFMDWMSDRVLDAADKRGIVPDVFTGPSHDWCFSGETEFLTYDGYRTLKEMVGQEAKVLDGRGIWVMADVRSFGVQSLYRIILKKGRGVKTIFATGSHEWLVDGCRVKTTDLSLGCSLDERLPRSYLHNWTPSSFGIAHGIVFGDGTLASDKVAGRSRPGPSRLDLWGVKGEELLRFFPGHRTSAVKGGSNQAVEGVQIRGLPRHFKDLPSLDSDPEYLLGWLAGYFAADGRVGANGSNIEISSARRRDLEFCQAVCTRLTIGFHDIRESSRSGCTGSGMIHRYGVDSHGECHLCRSGERSIFSMAFDPRTLDEKFFVVEEHRKRFVDGRVRTKKTTNLGRWSVSSVELTDRYEEVYCLVVPTTQSFVLQDGILTGNCRFRRDSHCLAGETEVLTMDGPRAIKSLAGSTAVLLDGRGYWIEAPIRSFGEQKLYEIVLERWGKRKTVYATAEHRWFIKNGAKTTEVVTWTGDSSRAKQGTKRDGLGLREGDRLATVAPRKTKYGWRIDPVGVMAGFVFGDGWTRLTGGGSVKGVRGSSSCVRLWGEKDAAIASYFSAYKIDREFEPGKLCSLGGVEYRHLPGFMNKLPDLNESPHYLAGWLAGYFAADGCVSLSGQAIITSVDQQAIEVIRGVCNRLNIVCYPSKMYTPRASTLNGKDIIPSGDSHSITFYTPSLPDGFFLIPKHAERAVGRSDRGPVLMWHVVSIDETDRVEEVFCATVSSTSSFALEGYILTGNCFFPQSLNVEATQVAGYPVWFVADRGFCPRQKWEAQQACPVGEPGPNAHGGGGIECTRNWNEGGQRDGRPMPMVSLDFGDPDKAFRDAGVQVYQRDQVM